MKGQEKEKKKKKKKCGLGLSSYSTEPQIREALGHCRFAGKLWVGCMCASEVYNKVSNGWVWVGLR